MSLGNGGSHSAHSNSTKPPDSNFTQMPACDRLGPRGALRVPSRDDDHEATASGDNDNEAHEATSRNPLQTELVPLAQAPMQDQNECVSVSLCHVHKQFAAPPCSRAKRIASDEKCALRGFSLEVLEGETVVLLGPNGAGKSTAIAVMLGLVSPSSGLVHALGIPVPSRAAELRARTGVCPQSASLFDELSVDDHLALAAGIRALPSRTARAEVVVLLRSSDFHKHRVRNLSANSPADRSKCYSLRSRY